MQRLKAYKNRTKTDRKYINRHAKLKAYKKRIKNAEK